MQGFSEAFSVIPANRRHAEASLRRVPKAESDFSTGRGGVVLEIQYCI